MLIGSVLILGAFVMFSTSPFKSPSIPAGELQLATAVLPLPGDGCV